MSKAHSESQCEPEVRSRRPSRPPRHLEDYEVDYSGFQHTYPPTSRVQTEPYRWESGNEGAVGMTPFTRWHATHRGDVTEDTGDQYVPQDAQTVIWQLREENRRLHKTIEDMKHSSEREETDSSQCPVPFPRTHSSTKATKKPSPVPTPRLSKLAVAQMSDQISKETGKPVMDKGKEQSEDEELDCEINLSGELSEMKLQPTSKNRYVQYQPNSPNPCTLQSQHKISVHAAQSASYAHDQRHIPPKPQIRDPSPAADFRFRERIDYHPRQHFHPRDFVQRSHSPPTRESIYRGPSPSIPDFTVEDPRQFARLKISLDNLLPYDATEQFKYQILLEHLKFEEALLIADSYSNSRYPYSQTMQSLTEHYGQPHQLALQKIADLMDGPNIRSGDTQAFRKFALRVRALVGMLDQLDEKGAIELQCGSHVARLMSKLPHDLKANFKRYVHPLRNPIPNLLDFSHWLEFELQVQPTDCKLNTSEMRGQISQHKEAPRQRKHTFQSTAILHGVDQSADPPAAKSSEFQNPGKIVYCHYCDNNHHYLNQCNNFTQLTSELKTNWIKSNKRCWRCGRKHQAAQCRLKATCKTCNGKHLTVLHDINSKSTEMKHNHERSQESQMLYLDRPAGGSQVLLKICKVLLRNGKNSIMTYAILDDGSERTILLHGAAQQLKLNGQTEALSLRTVRHDTQVIQGTRVSFTLSPAFQPSKRFKITGAFTAENFGLAKHSHPVTLLQRKYQHLKGLPLHAFAQVQPLLLIGSDHHHLIMPMEPVHFGPPGGPAAIRTRLGWTLQGPANVLQHQIPEHQCLFTSVTSTSSELLQHVERLWQLDILPYRNEKVVTRSRCDQEAITLLETKTVRVNVNGVFRYATPLLRKRDMPELKAPKESVLPNLRALERRLSKSPEHAKAYNQEIERLDQSGYVVKLAAEAVDHSPESWYIPHHMVHHNGKHRVVYNCSFHYQGHNLNEYLLAGPTLTSTLLGVLLRFREHAIAITSDIKGMFHQIRLLPEDKPLLRFLWRNMQRDTPVSVYEWQVLPFGTTCSPCCATFAVLKHVQENTLPGEETRVAVEKHFYVDNFLQSVTSIDKATELVNKIQALLVSGGFELRQWASNIPSVVAHLPVESRSERNELWLTEKEWDVSVSTLGLHWLCQADTLGYKARLKEPQVPTMRYVYQVVASQYDPLGYIIPFTTRAKVLIQRLWDKKREWDDPLLPSDLLQAWLEWEAELQYLNKIAIPRCYTSTELDSKVCKRDIHIFCDASNNAYGSVAYLRTESPQGQVEVAFITARSRVAPKRQLSVPRLELCAALSGAQLARLLEKELTLNIQQVTLWSDSKTVLSWIQSDSCRYKVFVGTRIAEIQELTASQAWHYVKSENNPADDITHGKTLHQLSVPSHWKQGPHFLWQDPSTWSNDTEELVTDSTDEEEKVTFCSLTTVDFSDIMQEFSSYHSFDQLVEHEAQKQLKQANRTRDLSAQDYVAAEISLFKQAQAMCFPVELDTLTCGKSLPPNSRLVSLAPEIDQSTGLIRVGGRLRRSELLRPDTVHPIVIDPKHPLSQLLIQHYDEKLHHPGPERVFAELRRKYWIIRGREAVRRHQHQCRECKKWRGKPEVPKMADLPPARLRLYRPAFYSTGVDCFGPYTIKVGRRNEKRWGIIFKCMTTRGVYIDLLPKIDTDSFLMALRRFTARRGTPHELYSDRGTNFKGGERELSEAFAAMQPNLQSQLAKQKIQFKFNPPGAPHFGGLWEREIRSLKSALNVTLGAQHVTEEVLSTVLTEIEGMLNSKPLGYVSSDVADVDPITPNSLLLGRPDPDLPQIVYPESELLSRKRWRHSQVLADHFWAHFIKRYLPELQTRTKWITETGKDLKTGTVVMIVDHQLPRALWPVGKVSATVPGADGKIRTAEVQVQGRKYIRPVSKLICLPPLPEDNKDS